jgi:Stigma-specific protein, Stig1
MIEASSVRFVLAALAVSGASCAFPTDWRAEPAYVPTDGGSCGNDSGAAMTSCEGRCVDTSSNASHCGACANACADTQRCVAGRCSATCSEASQCSTGELCVQGVCVYAPPPATVLSTALDEGTINVRHAPEQLRLSASSAVTFYYRLDGERPELGAMGTLMATGQSFVLPTLTGLDSPAMGACRTVRWFADYGPPLGREGIVHGASFCNTPANSDPEKNYETVDRLSFSVMGQQRGAIAVVAPGAGVALSFRLRTLNSGAAMMPARVSRIARVYLEPAQGGARPLFCHRYGDNATPPTGPTSVDFNETITAPMTAGRYPLRLSLASDPSSDLCSTLNGLGVIRTLGTLIVQ